MRAARERARILCVCGVCTARELRASRVRWQRIIPGAGSPRNGLCVPVRRSWAFNCVLNGRATRRLGMRVRIPQTMIIVSIHWYAHA